MSAELAMWGQVDTLTDPRCHEVRKCAKCAADQLTVVHVTQHYNRGLPMGRTYLHRCAGCKQEITTVSTGRSIAQFLSAGLFAGLGIMLLGFQAVQIFTLGYEQAFHHGGAWAPVGLGSLFLLGGLAAGAWATWLVSRLFTHPVVLRR